MPVSSTGSSFVYFARTHMSIDIRDESLWVPQERRTSVTKSGDYIVVKTTIPNDGPQGGAMRWVSAAGRGI